MPKKYLKGFDRFSIFPIVEDTEDKYIVGTRIPVISAQSLSKEEQVEEEDIVADDGIWDTDSDVTGEEVTFTVAELSNELRAELRGGTYNKETKTYNFKKGDVAPQLACSYRGLLADGTYRMWKQYLFKVSQIKMDLNTKGSGDRSSVEITGKFLARACDGSFYDIKDTEKGNEDLTWLDTIDEVSSKATIKVALPEAKTNVLGKTVEELQENIKIIDNKVTGTSKHIESYPEFSKSATGNFLALYFEEAKNGEDVMCELKGTGATVKKPKAVDKSDGLMVFNVHNKDNTIEITCKGKESRTLVLEGLELSQE